MATARSVAANIDFNSDESQVVVYNNPKLLAALNKKRNGFPIKASWVTSNLLLFDMVSDSYKLFDLSSQQECKTVEEQIYSTNTALRQSIVQEFPIETSNGNNLELVAMMGKDLLKAEYHFPMAQNQLAAVSTGGIDFWNTTNPSQLVIDKKLRHLLPDDIRSECNGFSRYGDIEPSFFCPAFFPDRRYVVIMYDNTQFYFKNVETGESFALIPKEQRRFHLMQIINNQQVLLTAFDAFDRPKSATYLMTVDLPNKRAKLHLDKRFTDYEKELTLPLASQLIMKINEHNDFTCYSVSPDGNEFKPIDALKGNATVYSRLESGEIFYWDKNTRFLTILDPFAQRILSLKEVADVTRILCCDRELLVVTPNQLLRCYIPHYVRGLTNNLARFFSSRGLQNVIFDYLDMNPKDNACLLTNPSFLKIAESENQAKRLNFSG